MWARCAITARRRRRFLLILRDSSSSFELRQEIVVKTVEEQRTEIKFVVVVGRRSHSLIRSRSCKDASCVDFVAVGDVIEATDGEAAAETTTSGSDPPAPPDADTSDATM